MKLRYRAFNAAGASLSAVIDATNAEEALDTLRQQGLFPTEIEETTASIAAGASRKGSRRSGGGGGGGGGKLKNVATFARHLQILVSSGTALTEALQIVERQMESPAWKIAVGQLRAKVEGGAPLSSAMAERPDFFDAVCRSLVAAGEASGELAKMLDRLATLARRQLKLRNTVVGAMVYPCLLSGVGVGVVITLFAFVLPRFSDLFKTLDVPLPPTTALLIHTGRWMGSYWWTVLTAFVLIGFALRAWFKSEAGKRTAERTVLSIPKLGVLLKNLITARLVRMLGVLLESSVPLLDSLQLVKAAVGNVCYQDLIARAEDAVTRGEAMSTVFASSALVNQSVGEAIRNGEHTGKLSALLLHVAEFLDEDNEIVLRAITSIIEPVILIVMGVFVGFIAVSMFLPLFDLVGMAQGGGHHG